jgi:ABC-type multidrug transport system ATPase subunit
MTSRFSIVAKGLTKRFNREWIFKNFDYEFTSENLYVVTGPNGSGKSTLLQVLAGFIPPSKGTITYHVNDKAVTEDEVFRHVSIATPYMDLIEEFTLREQLEFHFGLKPIRQGFTIDSLIELMYLEKAANKQIMNFSSGMKQRMKLAMAFYTDSAVLLLDEPGTNLDKVAFEWYRNQLTINLKDRIVLIASNDQKEYPEETIQLNIADYKL